MTLQERLSLIKQVGEEIINEEELNKLLTSGQELIAYDGFEPSGQIHIAQGLLRTININKMIKAGIKFKILIADWHALANNKLGGDLSKIQTVGKYFIEVWRACGMNLDKVEFIWASDITKSQDYWQLVLQVGRSNALRRFIRTAEMMGRVESLDNLTGANIIYSCMQVADIFTLKANITQLGVDQRKINMLAREIGGALGYWKPVVVSHHMLRGLGKPPTTKDDKITQVIQLKMSKSKPDSAIFMTDTLEDITKKINKAYCLEGDIYDNPILEYCRYIIFESFERLGIDSWLIERPLKWGGNLKVRTYAQLEQLFASKQIHPHDLKVAVIEALDKLLMPIRQYFVQNPQAKKLLEQIKNYNITR
jgi:tyrosyl-tRNA synthetase